MNVTHYPYIYWALAIKCKQAYQDGRWEGTEGLMSRGATRPSQRENRLWKETRGRAAHRGGGECRRARVGHTRGEAVQCQQPSFASLQSGPQSPTRPRRKIAVIGCGPSFDWSSRACQACRNSVAGVSAPRGNHTCLLPLGPEHA